MRSTAVASCWSVASSSYLPGTTSSTGRFWLSDSFPRMFRCVCDCLYVFIGLYVDLCGLAVRSDTSSEPWRAQDLVGRPLNGERTRQTVAATEGPG